MRRGTFIAIVVLFVLLLAAGVAQLVIASRNHAPLRGPITPGQLPTTSPTTS